ncbi:MAG: ribosome-associated translation inhibitor RaiA [Planctomycetes bacterium]|nr:ribosome-associated translation inhibitor RaiA [Planctomycetota bacterium]
MHIRITGRHMDVTEAMRSYVDKKIHRLEKYNNRISEMKVVIEGEGQHHKIEIIIKADNHQRFVANDVNEDAYACFDAALDKVERQLVKHKEKVSNHKGRVGAAEASVEIIDIQDSKDQAEISEE